MTFLKYCDNVGLMKITSEMISKFRKNILAWQPSKYTQDIKHVYAQDRKQLMQVFSLVKEGKLSQAGEKAYWLDTIVRDQIPNSVYRIITDAYEGVE